MLFFVCILSSSFIADVLGKAYGVVAKQRGRIVAEEMKKGSSVLNVSARLQMVRFVALTHISLVDIYSTTAES